MPDRSDVQTLIPIGGDDTLGDSEESFSLLVGSIADYAIFARKDRSSEDWYVGGVNDATSALIAREIPLMNSE